MSKLANPRNDRQVTLAGGFHMAGKPGRVVQAQAKARTAKVVADWEMMCRLGVWLGALVAGAGMVQVLLVLHSLP